MDVGIAEGVDVMDETLVVVAAGETEGWLEQAARLKITSIMGNFWNNNAFIITIEYHSIKSLFYQFNFLIDQRTLILANLGGYTDGQLS